MAFDTIGSEEDLYGSDSSDPTVASVVVPALDATNRIGLVFINVVNTAISVTVDGVTWDGVSMTRAVTIANGVSKLVEIWYLVGCAHNGTYNISVNWSGAIAKSVSIVTAWANADGTITLDDTSSETGTLYDCDIVSTQVGTNELVVSSSVSACNSLDAPVSPDATELQSWDSGGNCSITTYTIPAGSGDTTHTHGYNDTVEGIYAIASASFKEAGGAAALEINIDPFTYGMAGWKDGVRLWP